MQERIIAKSTWSTLLDERRSTDILPCVKISLTDAHKDRDKIQIKHSIIIGKNKNPPAIIANTPMPDFKSFKQLLTVPKASPKALPTIGTKLDRASFAVLLLMLSVEEETKFCKSKRAVNTEVTILSEEFISL